MKQTKTIPFDWELYNNNRDKYKVVTQHLKKIKQLTLFERTPSLPALVGVEGVTLTTWTESGHFRSDKSYSDYDLQLQYEEEVVESWVNLLKDENGRIVVSVTYPTKFSAERIGICMKGYIKTINLNDLV